MANAESTSAGDITAVAKATGEVAPTIDSAHRQRITDKGHKVKKRFRASGTENEKLRLSMVESEDAVPYYMTDMTEKEAARRGYPVIEGVQVVPLKTYVRAADRKNYGLEIGMGIGKLGEPTLTIHFRNKHKLHVPTAFPGL